MDNVKEFTDMYLIASLLSYGYTLVSADKKTPTRQKFFFKDEQNIVYIKDMNGEVHSDYVDLEGIRRLYQADRLLFPPSYPHVLKDLKQEIISYKQDGN